MVPTPSPTTISGVRPASWREPSLIVDYTLTVAVSIAAGVGQLTSAFPSTAPYVIPMCLGILLLITALNLRGLGEGARAFLIPTLIFIVGLLAIIAVGLIHPLGLGQPQTGSLPGGHRHRRSGLDPAGAQGVLCRVQRPHRGRSHRQRRPLFKEPRVARAKRTELLLGAILGVMLLGLAVLARKFHIEPRSGQTVLSQIMADAVGRHWAYYIVSLTITLVLALAANTSFGGLPVLTSLLSQGRLPSPPVRRAGQPAGVRQRGLGVLALASGLLLLAVDGNTNALIPLFAIGVFIGFTLSQAGLVVHWRRTREPGWVRRATINSLGAAVTAVATVIFLFTKFLEGAWVVVVAIPLLILLFNRVQRLLRPGGDRARDRCPSRTSRPEAHRGGGAGDQRVPLDPPRSFGGHLAGG